MLSLFRRSSPKYFLNRHETSQLIQRVSTFEKKTGCELVFHFRHRLGSDPETKNRELFHKFGLDKTSDRRAILVTLALQERTYAIWADEGVEKHAGQELHNKIGQHLKSHLKKGDHLLALMGVIDLAEAALKSSHSARHLSNEIPDKPIIEGDE